MGGTEKTELAGRGKGFSSIRVPAGDKAMTTTDACKILAARYGPVPWFVRLESKVVCRFSYIPLIGEAVATLIEIIWDAIQDAFWD